MRTEHSAAIHNYAGTKDSGIGREAGEQNEDAILVFGGHPIARNAMQRTGILCCSAAGNSSIAREMLSAHVVMLEKMLWDFLDLFPLMTSRNRIYLVKQPRKDFRFAKIGGFPFVIFTENPCISGFVRNLN